MELLYKDAEGRRQRQEKSFRELLQQEQLQREFKPLHRSHALLYKKFKKDFLNLLHSVSLHSNSEDSSSITIDKDTLVAVFYRLGLVKHEVCAAVLVMISPAAGTQRWRQSIYRVSVQHFVYREWTSLQNTLQVALHFQLALTQAQFLQESVRR